MAVTQLKKSGGEPLYPKLDVDNLKKLMLDIVYPVGSIYMSLENVSPSTFLGGDWERIEGRFLLGGTDHSKIITPEAETCSYDSQVGKIGGEFEHQITKNEIPSHIHHIGSTGQSGTRMMTSGYLEGSSTEYVISANWRFNVKTSDIVLDEFVKQDELYALGNFYGNNHFPNYPTPIVPPYLAVYMWKRVQDKPKNP